MAIADGMGLQHKTSVIEYDDIDIGKSHENRAREIPLDESRLEGIRHAMFEGIPIPKIFVRKVGAKYVIAGGNHRFNSLPKKTWLIHVHITECTDAEFETFCRALNTVVGVGLSRNERIRCSVDAVERLGMSRKDAAKLYGLTVAAVEQAARKSAVDKRIEAITGRRKTNLTQTHIYKLGELSNNDNILRAAADYVDKSKATTEELSQLACLARKQSTEADQVAIFTKAAEPYQKTKKVTVPRKHKKRFLAGLKQIEIVLDKKTWQDLEIETVEAESLKERVKKVKDCLNCLCKASG
jgi:transposase